MSPYKIDKNVPIARDGRLSKYPFKDMQEGDSFLVPYEDGVPKETIQRRVHAAAGANNIRVTTRRQKEGVRVWKTNHGEDDASQREEANDRWAPPSV